MTIYEDNFIEEPHYKDISNEIPKDNSFLFNSERLKQRGFEVLTRNSSGKINNYLVKQLRERYKDNLELFYEQVGFYSMLRHGKMESIFQSVKDFDKKLGIKGEKDLNIGFQLLD